ncbi:MAG: hypothetical protein KAV82_15545, partial [Phycisphaerae bacterium]|nr:hypothetical protein [Phycisphaerae bacterium]
METRSFHVPMGGYACIEVSNGLHDPPHGQRISAAELRIDDSLVIGPDAFSQVVDKIARSAPITAGAHTLSVRLASVPDAFVVVNIYVMFDLVPIPFDDPTVTLPSVDVSLDIQGDVALVQARYVLANQDVVAKTLTVTPIEALVGASKAGAQASWTVAPRAQTAQQAPPMPQVPSTTVTLAPAETQEVVFVYTIPTLHERIFATRIDPGIMVNSRLFAQHADSFHLAATLADTATRLVTATRPYQEVTEQDGRLTYSWSGADIYPYPLVFKWTDLDVNVEVVKTAVRDQNNVNVEISLTNKQATPVSNLLLEDVFNVGEVHHLNTADQPDFEFIDVAESDPAIAWRKTVPVLQPGETLVFRYTLLGAQNLVHVSPTTVYASPMIVAVSNSVGLAALPPPPKPEWQLAVVPAGWSFDFIDDDHHIKKHQLRVSKAIPDLASATNTDEVVWRWYTDVHYENHNADDPYNWSVAHAFIGLHGGYLHSGVSPQIHDMGLSRHYGRFQAEALKGFDAATVLLSGWQFIFTQDDHHIDRIAIKIENVSYDPSLGEITWRTTARYQDKNADDEYAWQYWWQVVGFNGGAVVYANESGSSATGRLGPIPASRTHTALVGRKKATVVPVGWAFNFVEDDHHINEHAFNVRNVNYNSTTGTVSWNAYLTYVNENLDDEYDWAYRVALLVFDDGEVGRRDEATVEDDGGYDSRNFSTRPVDIFTPIKWTNRRYDPDAGEEGVDCGGLSPSTCFDCITSAVDPGNADDADLYSLKGAELLTVHSTASEAIVSYAERWGRDWKVYYTGVEAQDRYVQAIA